MEQPIQKPSKGRIVIYNTTQQDRDLMQQHPECNVQKQLPAEVVATFDSYQAGDGGECNLKVRVDGDMPDLWKTSVKRGDGEGEWNWPARV